MFSKGEAGMADAKKDAKKFQDAVKKLQANWDDVAKELAAAKRFGTELGDLGPTNNGNKKLLDTADYKVDAIEKLLKSVESAIKTLEGV